MSENDNARVIVRAGQDMTATELAQRLLTAAADPDLVTWRPRAGGFEVPAWVAREAGVEPDEVQVTAAPVAQDTTQEETPDVTAPPKGARTRRAPAAAAKRTEPKRAAKRAAKRAGRKTEPDTDSSSTAEGAAGTPEGGGENA